MGDGVRRPKPTRYDPRPSKNEAPQGVAYPKLRRVRSPKTLATFHRQNPRCAILSCRGPAMPIPHHIHPQSVPGAPGDVISNLLSLDFTHHMGDLGPHKMGHRTWFNMFAHDLSDENREKVRAALRGLPKGMD